MKDDLLRHILTKWLLIFKMLDCHKIVFSNCETRRISSNSEIHSGYNEEKKICNKTKNMLFFQTCLLIFEETIEYLEKDELTTPDLSIL